MRFVFLAVSLMANVASGFTIVPTTIATTPTSTSTITTTQRFMSSKFVDQVPITITGNNIDVTDALQDYINKKLERPLGKLRSSGVIQDCNVHLIVNKNPKVKDAHRIEVNTKIVGTTIHVSEESPDMYASIDAISDRLTGVLKKYKERRLDGWHGGKDDANMELILQAMEDEDDEDDGTITTTAAATTVSDVDPEAPIVTKIRSFDLSKPISMEEAIFALDYVDHDFYVYRDSTTNDVNVVYKRNAGGIGLVQPEQ